MHHPFSHAKNHHVIGKPGAALVFCLVALALLSVIGGVHAEGDYLTVLHSFGEFPDGETPSSPLLHGSNGSFYGTTSAGGTNGTGTLFRLSPDGTVTVIGNFPADRTSAGNHYSSDAGLVQDRSGNFYFSDNTSIFQFTPGGEVTLVHKADDFEAMNLNAVILGSDGNLYGTTASGYGGYSPGTVFSITSTGALTTLHMFPSAYDNSPNAYGGGIFPVNGLIRGGDGNFYGTTSSSSINSPGTIFSITPDGSRGNLYIFDGSKGLQPNRLMLGKDGNFYGTATGDGDNGGIIFSITPNGVPRTLHTLAKMA